MHTQPEPLGDAAVHDGPLTASGWKTRGDTDGGRLAEVVDRMEYDVRARLADETAEPDRSWLTQTESCNPPAPDVADGAR